MASMTDFLDEDSLQKMFKRMNVDETNQKSMQGMAQSADVATPPPNPYAQTEQKKSGGWTSIVAPIMKLGGMALSAVGMPYVGIPLSIAGGAVGGAGGGGGMSGALGGAVKSGIGQAAGYGLGSLGSMGSGGYTIPGVSTSIPGGGTGGMFNTMGGASSAGGGLTIPGSASLDVPAKGGMGGMS